MRDGERLVKFLTFQEVDRPPYWQGFFGWDLTHERWRRESGVRNLNLQAYFDLDYGFEIVPVPLGMFPPFEREIVEESGEFYVERDEKGILMRQQRDKASMPEFLQHPVKGWDDWEQIKAERLDPAHPGRYHANWDAFNSYLESTGSVAQLGYFPYGVFGTARDLMGAEEVLVAFYDQPDLVHDIMDYLTDFWICIFDRVTDRVKVACIHLWEDMAGRQGSLISPSMTREFMMPNYQKIKDFAGAKGVPLMSVDSDGDVSELVPIMMAHGVNYLWPFEVQAGCDIEAYRRLYPQLGIMGGLDKRALAQERQAIDHELARAERMLQHGGYVASPDHGVPPDVPWDNYRYYLERLRELTGK
jgi:uroporphyrinogen-III decarboxylase